MKKEIFIIIVVISFIGIGHYITQRKTMKYFGDLDEKLSELRDEILNEEFDKSKVQSKIITLNENWSKEYNVLAMYVEHSELEKVEQQLTLIETCIETGENTRAIIELDRCRNIIDNIENESKFKLINIF